MVNDVHPYRIPGAYWVLVLQPKVEGMFFTFYWRVGYSEGSIPPALVFRDPDSDVGVSARKSCSRDRPHLPYFLP